MPAAEQVAHVAQVAQVAQVARGLADEVLFPDAMRVDRLDVLPVAHLDALAAAGLYGAPVPAEAGGLGLSLPEAGALVEELAGGCLAVAFVVIQHFRLVMTLAAADAPPALRDRWLASACQGRTRGGIALTGLIPGPPQLRAEPAAGGGWRLHGTAPWVTGWGLIDLVQVVARGPDDTVVTVIMDAAAQSGLTVTRQRLAAVDASVTVRLGFDGVAIPPERFVDQMPFDPAVSAQPAGLRLNGSLALGLACRCARLLGSGPLHDEVAGCRDRLDAALEAGPGPMAEARAAASELALRAAAMLAVRDGGNAVSVDSHAQRLAREAVFLLVFGSRPGIKRALLERLGPVGSRRDTPGPECEA
jgi:alkylation response protein AidB-like acyl-CoA dehydrogenase